MQSVKPIFLGALAGLGLGLAALAGLYASPLRQELYFSADPALTEARSRLETYQEWLNQADARIALQGPEADSLRAEQARVWRDYKAWRTRVGEMARVHAQPSGPGFLNWTYSLRYWDAPGAVATILLCALAGFLTARNRYRPTRMRAGKSPRAAPAPSEAHARALSDFQDAVKKVARISRPDPGPVSEPPPTDLLPLPGTPSKQAGVRSKEPETQALPLIPRERPPDHGDGRETHLFQVAPGWGESPDTAPSGGLSMEDEDAPGNTDATLGVMPPTTEVERVERRKEEVLKLARKGMTSSEISRRLRISQDQVEVIIRMRREKG
jgi:hypothetical protein